MELVFFWLLFAIVTWVAASSRGRSGFLWFLVSLIFSPIIGLLLVLVLPNLKSPRAAEIEPVTAETHVRCPECRELVRADARLCKHCKTALVPAR